MSSFLEKVKEDLLEMSSKKTFLVKIIALLEDVRITSGKRGVIYLEGMGLEIPSQEKVYLYWTRRSLRKYLREDYLDSMVKEYEGVLEYKYHGILPPCGFEMRRLPWFQECVYVELLHGTMGGYLHPGESTVSSKYIVFFGGNLPKEAPEIRVVYVPDLDSREVKRLFEILLEASIVRYPRNLLKI